MKILLTGSDGFIGSSLQPWLKRQGHELLTPVLELRDANSVHQSLERNQADLIIHLAALSHIPSCEKDPELAQQINVLGTRYLLDAIRKYQPRARLVFASSAQVYEAAQTAELQSKTLVFDEHRKLQPQNAYARTKYEGELAIHQANADFKLNATILRLFNHTHKSQSKDFFLPGVYHKILDGKKSPTASGEIAVGSLDLDRDIGSIQDLIRAFSEVVNLNHADVQTFNVCSGKVKRLRKLAEGLAKKLNVTAKFVVDPTKVRPNEAVSLCGSHEKLSAATGWRPLAHDEDALIQAFLTEAP